MDETTIKLEAEMRSMRELMKINNKLTKEANTSSVKNSNKSFILMLTLIVGLGYTAFTNSQQHTALEVNQVEIKADQRSHYEWTHRVNDDIIEPTEDRSVSNSKKINELIATDTNQTVAINKNKRSISLLKMQIK